MEIKMETKKGPEETMHKANIKKSPDTVSVPNRYSFCTGKTITDTDSVLVRPSTDTDSVLVRPSTDTDSVLLSISTKRYSSGGSALGLLLMIFQHEIQRGDDE